jgi:hypothetical protein
MTMWRSVMKLILILGLGGAIFCASMSALGQSKIEAEAEFEIKAEIAFPFKEKQITGLEWEYGEGGEWFSQVVKNHEHSFMCDYSCTISAELAEDAFFFLETREANTEGEHDVYIAEVNATIQRRGQISGWGYCDFEEEYSDPFILEVQDFKTEGWIDLTFMWGNPGPPCFTGPLSTKVIP